MTTTTIEETALRFVEAFGRGDEAALRELVTADVVFTSPRVAISGAEAVVAAIAEFGRSVTDVSVETVLTGPDQAMVAYTMTIDGLGALRVVDRLRFRDGLIAADSIVFDTYPLRRGGVEAGTSATVVRYRTLPEAADRNAELIGDVFAQLTAEDPGDVRYAAFRLDDGESFLHVVVNEAEGNPLTKLSAFGEFVLDFEQRAPGGTDRSGAALLGAYRMID